MCDASRRSNTSKFLRSSRKPSSWSWMSSVSHLANKNGESGSVDNRDLSELSFSFLAMISSCLVFTLSSLMTLHSSSPSLASSTFGISTCFSVPSSDFKIVAPVTTEGTSMDATTSSASFVSNRSTREPSSSFLASSIFFKMSDMLETIEEATEKASAATAAAAATSSSAVALLSGDFGGVFLCPASHTFPTSCNSSTMASSIA
mmetsp:Transcript_8386/g.18125  ORF Transcript_8386/g.18125 Transcript_8386/m.18125 type:complete len:204 (-) Transcript_8386:1467-2078(-)